MENENNEIMSVNDSALTGSVVNLPATKSIDTDSEDFYDIAVKPLSDSIQGEIKDLIATEKVNYSRFEIGICVIILIIISSVFYYFITPSKVKDSKITDISNSEVKNIIALDDDSEQGKILNTMRDCLKKGEYNNCLAAIQYNTLKNNIQNPDEFPKYKEILNCWFEAVGYLNTDTERKNNLIKQAAELADIARQADGQSPAWHLNYLLFNNFYIIQHNTYKNIKMYEKNWHEKARLKKQIEYFESLKYDNFDKKDKELFELYKCKIYVAYWLNSVPYAGRRNKQLLFDKWDNGVKEREEAYEIASRYQNNTDFLHLRKFIVNKIKGLDGGTTRYYFRGEKYFSTKHLNTELEIINQLLNRIK